MNPWFLTGFTDAEGCFTIGVVKNKKYKVGWTVRLRFQLGVNEKDKFLLLQSKNFFGVGNIYVSESAVQFIVQSVNDLAVIIKHFDKFSLITKKKIDFELFKQVFNIVINKEHITEEGLRKIVAIKASMNLGLSEELKTAFPNITPQDMPLIINQKISDPNWLVGFVTGEGCFLVDIEKSDSYRFKKRVRLFFTVTQHIRDELLIKSLIEYFDGCGNIYKHGEVYYYRVSKYYDIDTKIIPFFKKYAVKGIKSKNFDDFCKVAYMMKEKKHLTKQGLEQIKKNQSWNEHREKMILKFLFICMINLLKSPRLLSMVYKGNYLPCLLLGNVQKKIIIFFTYWMIAQRTICYGLSDFVPKLCSGDNNFYISLVCRYKQG